MTKQEGFSLVELLIVVAIILTLAAIAIPNLMRARMSANEASAVGSVHAINVAANEFNATYGDGYPGKLSEIGDSGAKKVTCKNAQLIDSVLTTGVKSGYTFVLNPGKLKVNPAPTGCTVGFADGYVVTAIPQTVGLTGQRGFCSDATGVIRSNPQGKAIYTSPLCSETMEPLD